MNTIITITVVAVLTVLIAIPFLASLGICAPKWWKSKVSPILRSGKRSVSRGLRSVGESLPELPEPVEKAGVFIWGVLADATKWVFYIFTFPLWGPVLLILKYGKLWGTIIYKYCPYSCEHGQYVEDFCWQCAEAEAREEIEDAFRGSGPIGGKPREEVLY